MQGFCCFFLRSQVLGRYRHLIKLRRNEALFAPQTGQAILFLDERVFALRRENNDHPEHLLVLINVSQETVALNLGPGLGYELISGQPALNEINLLPYQVMWLKCQSIHRSKLS